MRNTALSVAGLLLLTAVWVTPSAHRHSMGDSFGGSTSLFNSQPFVISEVIQNPEGWPKVTIKSISPVPGASIVKVWALPNGERADLSAGNPDEYVDPVEYIEALHNLTDDDLLPASVDSGTTTKLVILWRIDNCSLLSDTNRVEVALKTSLGTTVTDTLGDDFFHEAGSESPAVLADVLQEEGLCPN